MFASLDDSEKQILSDAMETVMVGEAEDLITQGNNKEEDDCNEHCHYNSDVEGGGDQQL